MSKHTACKALSRCLFRSQVFLGLAEEPRAKPQLEGFLRQESRTRCTSSRPSGDWLSKELICSNHVEVGVRYFPCCRIVSYPSLPCRRTLPAKAEKQMQVSPCRTIFLQLQIFLFLVVPSRPANAKVKGKRLPRPEVEKRVSMKGGNMKERRAGPSLALTSSNLP